MQHERFRVTWDQVTEESAELGDYADSGFMAAGVFSAYRGEGFPLPPGQGPDLFTLAGAVAALSDDLDSLASLECVEPNDSDHGASRWITATWKTNDGETVSESRSIHFPENLTSATRARLCRVITEAL